MLKIEIKILLVFFLLAIINAIGTFAYGARLAGVRSKSISSSSALFNILTLISRTSNMILSPLIGSIVEEAIKTNNIDGLTMNFRFIFLGATFGTAIAILLIPYMSDLLIHAINKLEQHKSIPMIFYKEMKPKNIVKMIKMFRLPSKNSLKNICVKNIPKGFLIISPIIYSIYTVGFLSALYAGSLTPENRLVASQMSSVINGFATISLYILVDPVLGVISDEAIKGKRPVQDIKNAIFFLSMGRLAGTVIAQLIFIPVAHFIVWASQIFI